MVHAQVYDKYIQFELMYTTDNIYPVLKIKHLVNKDGEPTTPQKLETGTKTSVSNLRLLFCPCVVRKATAHVDTKVLNMRHKLEFFLWHLSWNTTTPKKAPHLHT